MLSHAQCIPLPPVSLELKEGNEREKEEEKNVEAMKRNQSIAAGWIMHTLISSSIFAVSNNIGTDGNETYLEELEKYNRAWIGQKLREILEVGTVVAMNEDMNMDMDVIWFLGKLYVGMVDSVMINDLVQKLLFHDTTLEQSLGIHHKVLKQEKHTCEG